MMHGKVALITGSTAGIGLGVAKCLAAAGSDIIVTGLGSEEVINNVQKELKSHRTAVNFIPADVRQADEVKNLCEEARRLHPSGVDILVNNAGLQFVSPVEDFPVDKWNCLIEVLLTAPFLFTKYLLPDMKKKNWGRIINIASVHGLVASTNKAAYVSAKHGLVGLTKVVAYETAKTGVTCNAICPGWVATSILEGQIDALAKQKGVSLDEAKGELLKKQPSQECVTVDQIGEMVKFMCSPAADNMRGAAVTLDGGWTIS